MHNSVLNDPTKKNMYTPPLMRICDWKVNKVVLGGNLFCILFLRQIIYGIWSRGTRIFETNHITSSGRVKIST